MFLIDMFHIKNVYLATDGQKYSTNFKCTYLFKLNLTSLLPPYVTTDTWSPLVPMARPLIECLINDFCSLSFASSPFVQSSTKTMSTTRKNAMRKSLGTIHYLCRVGERKIFQGVNKSCLGSIGVTRYKITTKGAFKIFK